MLVLTRKLNERVMIGDPDNPVGWVKIAAIEVKENGEHQVRLGFELPPALPINREEVLNQRKQQ